MTKTITVEGDLTATDAVAALTTQGSVTIPSRQVPAGVTTIKRIIVAVAADLAAAAAVVFLLRLTGTAIKGGEQVIVVGAEGGQAVQTGSDQAPSVHDTFELDNVDIEVSAGDTLTIQGEMAGGDVGTARMVVTIVFA